MHPLGRGVIWPFGVIFVLGTVIYVTRFLRSRRYERAGSYGPDPDDLPMPIWGRVTVFAAEAAGGAILLPPVAVGALPLLGREPDWYVADWYPPPYFCAGTLVVMVFAMALRARQIVKGRRRARFLGQDWPL